MSFDGFEKGTFEFLAGLTAHNDKRWFEAHREDYERYFMEAGRSFVEALGPRLRKIDKSVSFEPKVGGSLMRIHRDVRFSKDKSPYKTHLDAWFWTGKDKGWSAPGYFFRMHADRLLLGGGMHHFEKPHLEAFRAAVVDPKKGKALDAAVASLSKAGITVGGQAYKKVPRGFDPDHPRAQFLLHDGLHGGWEGKLPKQARKPEFIDFCAEHFAACTPIVRWLASVLPPIAPQKRR